MLYEYDNARQVKGEPFRRWFGDDDLDLIVWYKSDETTVLGFQLCYQGQDTHRRAFTWSSDDGFSHRKIDEGESNPGQAKMSPILILDGVFHGEPLRDLFAEKNSSLPTELQSIVLKKIEEFTQRSS